MAQQEREVVMQWTNEWIERGRQEGRQEERRDLVLRQLRRRLGVIPAELTDRISLLPDSQLGDLAEALIDFRNLTDAEAWFDNAAAIDT